MKTHLLALEPHDDLVSVKDRMTWAKTPRILLIWPKGEPIALRPLELKMLQRHARSLGASLGLVTRDPRVQREAAALGLPVFQSPRAAQAALWPDSAPPKFSKPRTSPAALRALHDASHPAPARWQTNSLVRVVFFALGVFAVLTPAALFVPSARITLSPETKVQQLTIPVTADPALTSVFITGNIPARAGTRETSGSWQIPSTGETAVPQAEAKGVARFRNLTASPLQLPAGLVVTTLGAAPIRFATTQEAMLPGGIGKTVDVPIEAIGAGARGNLDVDLIQSVDGPLGLALAVTNPAPTSGGTDASMPAPSAADRERLHGLLMDSLRKQAQLELLANLPRGSIIFPDTIRPEAVIEETYDPPAGGTGSVLSLTMRVKFSALYASGDDLAALADLAMHAALEDGFSASAAPSLSMVGSPVTDAEGKTSFQLQMTRKIFRSIDPRRVVALTQGRHPESASARLKEAFALSSPPVIQLTPGWWPWLPLVPFRMNVVMK